MKKAYISIIVIAVSVLAIAAWLLFFRQPDGELITIRPVKGTFHVTVTTTGELQAKSSIEVRGPTTVRQLGIGQMKISRLIPEGTIVKKGDFVAELDKSEVLAKVKEIELSIQKYRSQYEQAQLDSALSLAAARDELENLKFSLEEKKLEKEQSIYEPPSVIRKVEIDYDRTARSFDQSVKNYTTKVRQSIAKLQIAGADLSKEKGELDKIMQTFNDFTITAPADGMVIYAREWGGRRKVVGSQISFWDPVVATLPDLTTMESITYVNEIDIQKIKKGQYVRIGLDANPNKKMSGFVTSIANIGEQRVNSDSKVFEVHVQIQGTDSTLLPSMTTSNEFLISEIKNAIYVPLECIHSEKNYSYVFKKSGGKIVKQQVELGAINDNEAIIKRGIIAEDEIVLSTVPDAKELKIVRLQGK